MDDKAGLYHFLVRDANAVRGNVTQGVTAQLREAIVTLALKPGEMLDKGAICKRLGVSRFPVSEALARLQAEGLVDILPQRGSVVSRVRIVEVLEYMLLRKALEGEAVRVLTLQGRPELTEAIRANLAAQERAAEAGQRGEFHRLDLQFHDLLSESLHLARLKAIIEGARANLDRARRLLITPRRHAESLVEHRAVFAALERRDAASAVAAMRAHIDSVVRELLAFAREQPQLFADGGRFRERSSPEFPYG